MAKRILTGMRTTGRLHLGHYVGALDNWLKLQNEYDCYFLLADVQALTTHFDRAEGIEDSVRQVVTDWLSVGLDPKNSSFLLQSRVHDYYELTALLAFFANVGELQSNPTIKEEMERMNLREGTVNVGFFSYPVSQASDILLFSSDPTSTGDHELLVPVGQDQAPHIELTRDIARRFNRQYGEIFVIPKVKLSDVPRLGDLGASGAKMGKSAGNAIFLSDTPEDVSEKVRSGITDPNKARKGDPGNPEICPIFSYHKIFRKEGVSETEAGCRSGQLGCVECKVNLSATLNQMLDPIRAKRLEIEAHPDQVSEAISRGTERARAVGQGTIQRVRHAMHLDYPTVFRA